MKKWLKPINYFFYLVVIALFSLEGSPKALAQNTPTKGGKILKNLGAEPPTLHPITSVDASAGKIASYVLDRLMDRDPDTYEFRPGLAEKFDVSKDGKEFLVTLRKDATFSDGKPVTAEDVKFSFDVYFDDAYQAFHMRPYLEGIAKAEIVNEFQVRFTTKETYFKNQEIISGLEILPKHFYGDAKTSIKKNKVLLGSGPYTLASYEQGKRIILKRNPKWWGFSNPAQAKVHNFDEIHFRFIRGEEIELEMLKSGQLDTLFLTAEAYIKKTDGPVWTDAIRKFKVQNKQPQGSSFVAWNFKDPLFADVNTRKALGHLMNRELMNEKFRMGMSKLATGPWYQDSLYASPKVKPLEFSPEKARKLLKQAGWEDSDKDGILDKMIDGKKVAFRFTLLNPTKDIEKYLTLYKEDLAKAGVHVDLQLLEWNTFIKLLEERKFQAMVLGWGGGSVDVDPKQVWHSASAVTGGSNFIDYKNPEVDKLIDLARSQLNRKDRIKTLQKVYEIIAADAPYTFMFNSKYYFYANRKQIATPKDTFIYDIGEDHWWLQAPQ